MYHWGSNIKRNLKCGHRDIVTHAEKECMVRESGVRRHSKIKPQNFNYHQQLGEDRKSKSPSCTSNRNILSKEVKDKYIANYKISLKKLKYI